MSKHQTCKECRCDFVGPDSNINDNLCELCGQELHGECQAELAEYAAVLRQLHAGIAVLEEKLRLGGMLANCIPGLKMLLFDGSGCETGGDHLIDIIRQLGSEGT